MDTGIWPLAEYENREFILNKKIDEFTEVEEYLKIQGRFSHLQEEEIRFIEKNRDLKSEEIRKNWRI